MHERVDRIGQAKDWLGRWQDRIQGRGPRPIRFLNEMSGESLTQWVVKNVLYAKKRPVPSFGFGLTPVLTHSVAARRQRRLRGTTLMLALAYLGASHPRGLTAITVVMLLWQFFWGRWGRAILRWGSSSLVSMVLLTAAVLGLWTLTKPRVAMLHDAAMDGVYVAFELLIAATIVHLLDRWAAHAYLQSVRPSRERIANRPHLAPLAAKKVDACGITEMWQSIAYRTEGGVDRFVGAGVNAWRRGATRIQLTPARTSDDDNEAAADVSDAGPDGYRKFEADELLDKVRDELEDLRGVLVETHALPNCDVAEFLGVPESRWKTLPHGTKRGYKAAWPEAAEMCAEARQSPTGHFSRRYLAAQVISWDGQIVVTVFAHAALEGKTLHFVTRPHVLAPLLPAANKLPAKGWELAKKLAATPLHAFGDTIALAARLYTYIGRGLGLLSATTLAAAMEMPKDDGMPVSLREYCSLVEPEDMHQTEDVQRYMSILQTRMFSTVSAFLADHGLATGEFQRQAVAITQNFISGDNNQVNTGNVDGSMNQQGSAPGPADLP